MFKKLGIIWVLAAILVCGSAAPIAAADEIQITRSFFSGLFPASISFSLTATSETEIVGARLHYRVQRQNFAEVENEVVARFTRGKEVEINYTLDLRRAGGLPPGTAIEFWWTLTDAGGGVTTSEISTFKFDDTRYKWQSLEQGMVTLLWYSGSDNFAKELMATAQEALVKLERDTGARLSHAVSLYIYDGAQELQGSMVFPHEWTGGVAFVDFNTIAIGIEPSNLIWGKRAITHELAHLVTGQMTDNPYNSIPTWLNEGLSMYAEGPLDATYVMFFNQSADQNTLLSVNSLSSPFSALTEISYLSYAESYHIVKYLVDEYGQDKMLQLLSIFTAGSTADEALEAVYGFDMEELNTEWQLYAQDVLPERQNAGVIWSPWLVVLIVLVAGASVIAVVWLFYPMRVAAAGNEPKNELK